MGRTLLIVVIGFSTIFTTLILQVTSNQQVSSRSIVRQYERLMAENALESVTNVANSKIYQNFSWSTGYSGANFNGALYDVDVTNITGDSVHNAEKDSLNIRVSYESIEDTCVTILIRPAYSHYFLLFHNWNNALQFQDGDTLRGPVHNNDSGDQIAMTGSPVFLAEVSSVRNTTPGGTPQFHGGVEFGTGVISMDAAILTPLLTEAGLNGHVYAIPIWVEFTGTTYTVYSDAYVTPVASSISLTAFNGTIYSSSAIHVKGTVDGRITVITDSHNDLWIEDDIVCASDPSVDPTSDDFIGLIAEHRVWIADNVDNQTDVIIHAAILSRHDQLDVQNSGGGPFGTLTLVGSLVAQNYVNSIASDYVFNHIYDARLIDKKPPYYPRAVTAGTPPTPRVEEIYRSK